VNAPAPIASSTRVRYLDGLRGIAIGFVLIHHFVVPLLGNVPGSPGAYAAAILTLSYSGVDLFFVLSGYLIGGILLDHRESPRLFTMFYVRRAARILPLAVLCVDGTTHGPLAQWPLTVARWTGRPLDYRTARIIQEGR